MSFRAPALHRKRSTASTNKAVPIADVTSTNDSPRFVPIADVQRERRIWRSSHSSTILPGPELHIPEGIFVQVSTETEHEQNSEADDSDPTLFKADAVRSPAKYSDKKALQWKRWTEIVIPSLLRPFLTILRESSSLRELQREIAGCVCGAKKINIVGVYFERMFI